MGVTGVVVALIFFVVHAMGVYRLARVLPMDASLEFVTMLVGLVLAVVAVLGMLFNRRWGWPVMLVVFSLGLANAVFFYMELGMSVTLALVFGVTIVAMLVSFVAVDLWEPDWQPEETIPKWDKESDAGKQSVTSADSPKIAAKAQSRKRPAKKKQAARKKRKAGRR